MWLGDVPRPGTRKARPLLYLDVDGVLNPEEPRPGFAEHAVGRLTVRVNPVHGTWLQDLSARYDLVWATTWEEHANEYIGPLVGLPPLPHVEISAYASRDGDPRTPLLQLPRMRKWAPILRHAEGRPFAWVDDVIPLTVRRQAFPHRRALRLIPVRPEVGLTRHHVDALHRWGARLERRGFRA
ncbi:MULTISPECIES: HAD domain-containing protein [Actinomadura]|uniref:HAD domain-containing protein n=1 Tax=Actinomadura TaxID=1988 RepID=UPI0003AD71AD|nr:HAD domain-containing protein [Actinomadura madurae]MCP9953794.1 HAD domain-containing protein [Actinomadura madurae]MCP9970547.1 HAD domain-containing protein [Actinomadura madurae]MCP9983021.1 HAD domain-containing protein [Actinomadura madurae]MCQ0005424.1 HAD domain-containing protein [Actinomadura madurae]MCQ0019261.1 HAD domain-containing protein [Actinomadura madurae]